MKTRIVEYVLSKTVIIPVVVTILCLAPFFGKPFHIDDPLFIWSAKQIQKNPTDFYGFSVNWYGTKMPMSRITKNPPLTCYYIALVASVIGFSEIALHIALAIPTLAAVLGIYYLAKRFCSRPALATLASVLTPAFLVSSSNIMCDTMMLAFWVWAMFFWMDGIKSNKPLKLLIAAVLIAACALTKYFGIALLLLLLVYSLMEKRRLGLWVLFLLIPVVILAGYQWATQIVCGKGLLLDAAAYATKQRWLIESGLFTRVLIGLAFAGGCVVTALFYIPLLWSRRVVDIGVLLTILFILGLSFMEKIGISTVCDVDGIKWSFLIQLGLMIVGGVSLLALAGADLWNNKRADSLMLLLWILGTFIFAVFINWTTNARSILPMVPAVGILLARRVESRKRTSEGRGVWRLAWPLIPAMVITMLVCWADYKWALTTRNAAIQVHEKFKDLPGKVWFHGHWGFQYYMEANGYEALDYKHSKLRRGDIVIRPTENSVSWKLPENTTHPKGIFVAFRYRWLAVMGTSLQAGFYTDRWGSLPFIIGKVEPEKYYVDIIRGP